ncbi:MAG: DUF2834 domain-containing protein [Pleurocapsa sp.]
MKQKFACGLIWLALVIYAVASSFFKSQEGDLDLIINLTLGKWSGINPIVIAIFYIMGVFPWVYAAFILFDSTEQKISPYPFFIASMGVGAFALLPYFALRQPNTAWNGDKNWLLKILDSRLMAIISSITIVVLLVWGLTQGNWSDFVNQWQTSQFVHVMTLDFCLLSLLFPAMLGDDMKRRGINTEKWFWRVALVPLLGSLTYWCLRPQLPKVAVTSQSTAS